MNPSCFFAPVLPNSVAAGPWFAIPTSLRVQNSPGAMISADPSNDGALVVLVLEAGSDTPDGDASPAIENVWLVKPGESIYGQGLAASRLICIGCLSGNLIYTLFEMASAPPGISRYGGDPITPYGQNWAIAPASWITGTAWTADSDPPLPSLIKSLWLSFSAQTTAHLEFDGGGQTALSLSPIGPGRTPFFPGIPITQIHAPESGQEVTGLIVEF